jgi:hypothetical protein
VPEVRLEAAHTLRGDEQVERPPEAPMRGLERRVVPVREHAESIAAAAEIRQQRLDIVMRPERRSVPTAYKRAVTIERDPSVASYRKHGILLSE